jgi:hypothetical protein
MHSLNNKQVLDKLGTSLNGLTSKLAKEKLNKDGKNVIEKVKKQSFFVKNRKDCFLKRENTLAIDGILCYNKNDNWEARGFIPEPRRK